MNEIKYLVFLKEVLNKKKCNKKEIKIEVLN